MFGHAKSRVKWNGRPSDIFESLNGVLQEGVTSPTWFWYVMMTSSNGNIFCVAALCAGNLPVTGEFPIKDQWRRALMFYLIRVWINRRVNNRGWWFETLCVHYDVIVMFVSSSLPSLCLNQAWSIVYCIPTNKLKRNKFESQWHLLFNKMCLEVWSKNGTHFVSASMCEHIEAETKCVPFFRPHFIL